MNLTDEEMARLEACTNETEWNAACDAVKKARDGRYPNDWFPRVNASGMMARVLSRFGQTANIKISTFKL